MSGVIDHLLPTPPIYIYIYIYSDYHIFTIHHCSATDVDDGGPLARHPRRNFFPLPCTLRVSLSGPAMVSKQSGDLGSSAMYYNIVYIIHDHYYESYNIIPRYSSPTEVREVIETLSHTYIKLCYNNIL